LAAFLLFFQGQCFQVILPPENHHVTKATSSFSRQRVLPAVLPQFNRQNPCSASYHARGLELTTRHDF
jgi:hypothetical protein